MFSRALADGVRRQVIKGAILRVIAEDAGDPGRVADKPLRVNGADGLDVI